MVTIQGVYETTFGHIGRMVQEWGLIEIFLNMQVKYTSWH